MKKTALFAIALLIFAVAGCGGSSNGSQSSIPSGSQSEQLLQGAKDMIDLSNKALDNYEANIASGMGAEDALNFLLDELGSEPNLTDVSYYEEGATVRIVHTSGKKYFIYFDSQIQDEYNKNTLNLTNNSGIGRGLAQKAVRSPTGSKSAHILLPFAWSFNSNFESSLKDQLISAGFAGDDIVIKKNASVKPEDLVVSDIALLYIDTHGGAWYQDSVTIATGVEATLDNDEVDSYNSDYDLTLSQTMPDRRIWVTVTPDYVRNQLGANNALPNSIVYVDACHSLENDTMADAYLNSGAITYWGWVGATDQLLINDNREAVFDVLTTPGGSVEQAYSAVSDNWPLTREEDCLLFWFFCKQHDTSFAYKTINDEDQYYLIAPHDTLFVPTITKHGEEEDLDGVCKSEIGQNYRLADWNDIVNVYTSSIESFFDMVGLESREGYDMIVMRDGEGFYNSIRHYFITRFDHDKPAYYMSHANIDDHHLDLGSWYGLNMRVLCYRESLP